MTSTAVKPVVVGIDGSAESSHAARWAVEEAVGRKVPLRLVYVVRTDLTGQLSADQYQLAVDDAKLALHAVRSDVESVNRSVVVQTEIMEGAPAGVLLAESPYADMICVGASGLGRLGRAILGSTAAAVAEHASCSVAIIHSPSSVEPVAGQTKWVMVPVSIFTDNELFDVAVDQARTLGRPILAVGVWHPDLGATPYDALDRLVAGWQARYPDVHIYPVSDDASMSGFLHAHPDLSGLVVVDPSSAVDVATLIGNTHDRRHDAGERAVFVVRNYANAREADATLASPRS